MKAFFEKTLNFCFRKFCTSYIFDLAKTVIRQDCRARTVLYLALYQRNISYFVFTYTFASFDFYLLVLDTCFRTRAIVSFNIEKLNSGANPPLQALFINVEAAIATFKNLMKMAVLKRRLNRLEDGKGRLKGLSYVPRYT